MSIDAAPPRGIAVEAVSTWLEASIEDFTGPYTFDLVAGGRSNLTFRVTDAKGRALALRRPPVSHVLPTAHDMVREFTILNALQGTGVPVPTTFGLCLDGEVNERPFYVMEFVDGHILRDAATATSAFSEKQRSTIGPNLAATLAGLHRVDVDAIGLGDLARKDAYIERQLKRWRGQYDQMQVEGVSHDGLIEAVGDALAATIPPQQAVSIVHGDYRLDNVVLNDAGEVAAILDWEICTLGDPLADIGLLMVYWSEAGDASAALLGVSPTMAPGFSPRAEVLETYGKESGYDLSRVAYYQAFGYWKLACILQGVFARSIAGASGGDTSSVDSFPQHVALLAQTASDLLERSPQ